MLVVACKHRAAAAHTAPPHELIYHSFLLQAFLLLSLRASTKRDRELFYLEFSRYDTEGALLLMPHERRRGTCMKCENIIQYNRRAAAASGESEEGRGKKRAKIRVDDVDCRRWWRWSASVYRNFFDFPIISILLLFSCFAKKQQQHNVWQQQRLPLPRRHELGEATTTRVSSGERLTSPSSFIENLSFSGRVILLLRRASFHFHVLRYLSVMEM